MPGRLSGKRAFVTGAAQGIGRSIVEAFLREGASVIASDLQAEKLADLAALGAETLRLDVLDEDAVRDAAERFGDVRVLVNCVGYVANGTILDASAAELRRSFDINVVSMLITTAAFLPAMAAAQDGSIINIGSVVSGIKAAPDRFIYATTKGAVSAFTKSVARDFAAQRVRCNCISPGTVETPSLDERMGGDPVAKAAFVKRQPMGRLGRAEEIAQLAVLIASDEAAFMTGSDVVIDGGMSL